MMILVCWGTPVQEANMKNVYQLLDFQLFTMMSTMLDFEDVETKRNIARALTFFSTSKSYLPLLADANIFPKVVEMFENTDNDLSVRRYALSIIANFAGVFKNRFFSEARMIALIKVIEHYFTEDLMITDAIRALANLSEHAPYAQFIYTTLHASTSIQRLLNVMSGSDTLTVWEIATSLSILPQTVDKNGFKTDLVQAFRNGDTYNYESIRLLGNLLEHGTVFYLSFIFIFMLD
jgi:hypothetical protein